MATLAQIVNSIRDQASGLMTVDDTRLRDTYLQKLVADRRAFLIEEEAKRGLGLNTAWLQVIDCLELQCEDILCEGKYTFTKQFFVRLPSTVSSIDTNIYLGTIDQQQPFRETSMTGFQSAMPGRFGKTTPVYTVLGDKALVKFQPSGLRTVRYIGILSDPVDTDSSGCGAVHWEEEYPVPGLLVARLETLCLQQILSVLSIQPDMANNAKDDTAVPQARP